jgi:plastocyanin
MINPARKRSTLVILVIGIVILSAAVLSQFEGRTNPPVGPSTTLSSSTSSAASLTQQGSTSTASSSGKTSIFIGFNQDVNSLRATPSVTMNYTLVISQLYTTASHVALSAASTTPGVTLGVNPSGFTFLGAQDAVILGITVAPTVNASFLPVEITATTANGRTNASFSFILDKGLIVVPALEALRPPTLHVSVGQTVTWLDLVELDDDGNGYTNVTLMDGSVRSPTMVPNDVWSYTFDKPGTYPYLVAVLGRWDVGGVVVVS